MGATLRKQIAGTGTALVLAITFGVMGKTGIALARGDSTATTSLAATQTLTGSGGGFGNGAACRTPMLVHIPE
jgi:hypothetical protein